MGIQTQTAADEVFDHLKRRGPMSPDQIALDLGRSIEIIRGALAELEQDGVVEPRPDREEDLETPWGLKRPRFRI